MAIKVQCPSCNAVLSAQKKLSHKTMKCPKCRKKFRAVPIEELEQARRDAHDKMVKAKERIKAKKEKKRKPKEAAKPLAGTLGSPQQIPRFRSFDAFITWWESPEIEDFRLKNAETVAHWMEHRFIKPWVEQLLAGADDTVAAIEASTKVPTAEDRQFALFLVKYGLLPEPKVQDVLALQKRLAEQGKVVPLGRLVALKGYISAQDIGATLRLTRAAKQRYSDVHYASTEMQPAPVTQDPEGKAPDTVKEPLPVDSPASAEGTGKRFGRYNILGELGHGGMGIVYKAHDPELNRTVALKMILGREAGIEQEQVDRFIWEARSAARLKHKNIVQIHDFGEEDSTHYFTMDYVEGISLEGALTDKKKHKLSPKRIVEIVRDVADALDYAHSNGIIHRDIKPANIILGEDGKPYLTDFGLAKQVKGLEESLTLTGYIMGTPYYMSPEQARGEKELDSRSDIFSLGVVMYEVLTGCKPFGGSQIYAILDEVVRKKPTRPRRVSRTIGKDVEAICLKCLEKSKERRYDSARELSEDITRHLEGNPVLALTPAGSKKKSLALPVAIITGIAVFAVIAFAIALSAARDRGAAEQLKKGMSFFERGDLDAAITHLKEAIRLDPELASQVNHDLAWAYRKRGNELLKKNNFEGAIADFTELIEIEPKDAPAYYNRGLARWKEGDLDGSIADHTKAVQVDPELAEKVNPRLVEEYFDRGKARENNKDFSGAITDYSEAIAIEPSARLYQALGMARSKSGDAEGALADWTKATEMDPSLDLEMRGVLAAAHLNRGTARKDKGDFDGATTDYTKAIELNPGLAEAYKKRGFTRSIKHDFSGAIADWTKAVEIAPDLAAEIKLYLAEAYLERGKSRSALESESALRDFDKAIENKPTLGEAYLGRANVRRHKGDFGNAIADLKRAIELSPELDLEANLSLAQTYLARGNALRREKDFSGAIASYAEAIKFAPHLAEEVLAGAHSDRASLKRREGDFDGAIADYTKAIEINPNDAYKRALAGAYGDRALLKRREGDLNGAIADYTKAIEFNPGDANAYKIRATARKDNGDFDGAIADYTKMIQINPEDTQPYNDRGIARYHGGDFDGAIADFSKVIQMEPRAVVAYSNRGTARYKKGDLKGALKDFEEYLRLLKDDPLSFIKRYEVERMIDDLKKKLGK